MVGPHEVAVNTGELLGRTQAEGRLLAHKGWRVVHLTVADLTLTEPEQQSRIAVLLQGEGVLVNLPTSGQGEAGSKRRTPASTSAPAVDASRKSQAMAPYDVEERSVAGPFLGGDQFESEVPHYTSHNSAVP